MFKDYEHHAQYYETDQMGCVHHSNYPLDGGGKGKLNGTDGLRV